MGGRTHKLASSATGGTALAAATASVALVTPDGSYSWS